MSVLLLALVAATVGALALGKRNLTVSTSLVPGSRILTIDGRRVLVHVPMRLSRPRTVLYFHGFGQSIDTIATTLVPLLDKATYPAILVVPQLGALSEPGSLADTGAIARLLRAALVPTSQIDILAHSGGYKAAAAAVARGGARIASLGLLDALYGELPAFEAFLKRSTTHHLANVYGPSTQANSQVFERQVAIPHGGSAIPSSAPDEALMHRFKFSSIATRVFHPDVPAAYGAAMIDAFA